MLRWIFTVFGLKIAVEELPALGKLKWLRPCISSYRAFVGRISLGYSTPFAARLDQRRRSNTQLTRASPRKHWITWRSWTWAQVRFWFLWIDTAQADTHIGQYAMLDLFPLLPMQAKRK